MANYLLPNSNKVLAEPVACWFSVGCSLAILKASRTCRRLKSVICFVMAVFSTKSCRVSFRLWTSLKCFLIVSDWSCIIRRLDRVVVVIPIYLAWARSSHSPSLHLNSLITLDVWRLSTLGLFFITVSAVTCEL